MEILSGNVELIKGIGVFLLLLWQVASILITLKKEVKEDVDED